MRRFAAMLIFVPLFAAPCLASAPSPLSMLSDAEKSYYTKVFDYSMDVIKPGNKYSWASYSGKGSITVNRQFISKSGYLCRSFNESYNVLGQIGTNSGTGCKRAGADGWCKLKEGDAMTCALEHLPFFSEGGIGGVNSYSMPDMDFSTGGIGNVGMPDINMPSVSMPSVSMPNMPSVSMPSMPAGSGGSRGGGGGSRSGSNNSGHSGAGIANSVTGTAGRLAGESVGTARSWFNDVFR